MRALLMLALVVVLLRIPAAEARPVVACNERLDPDRPEARAMYYFATTGFMAGFGATPELAPGNVRLAVETGHIPHLDTAQRQFERNPCGCQAPSVEAARRHPAEPGRRIIRLDSSRRGSRWGKEA